MMSATRRGACQRRDHKSRTDNDKVAGEAGATPRKCSQQALLLEPGFCRVIVLCDPAQARRRPVPVIRYFILVGGVLLALLFVADWYWPIPSPMPSYGAPIDETILRIRSAHKWPRKVELDTTVPIIVPPSPPATETAQAATIPNTAAPGATPALNALAQAEPPQKQVAKRKAAPRARSREPHSYGPTRFAVNPMSQAWPTGW